MPARTCGTARPTNGTRVVTLAPDWPVAGSIAHSENVEYCGLPSSLMVTPSAARCANVVETTRLNTTAKMNRFMIPTIQTQPEPRKQQDARALAYPQPPGD